MPKMRFYDGSKWVALDSQDAATLGGKGPDSFAPSTHVGTGGAAHALATDNTAGFISGADQKKLNSVQANAQENQHAFAKVKVGTTVVAADEVSDTLELIAGTGVKLTPDATNDKITLAMDIPSLQTNLSGKVNVAVTSASTPTTNLTEGMFWFNPTADEVRVYLGGRWRSIENGTGTGSGGGTGGGSGTGGGAPLSYITGTYKMPANGFNATLPFTVEANTILFVFKNSTFLQEGRDYTIASATSIRSVSEEWKKDTTLDFLLISGGGAGGNQLIKEYSAFVATSDNVDIIPINIGGFDKNLDILDVYYKNLTLNEEKEWEFYGANSIRLLGFSIASGEEVRLRALKQSGSGASPTVATAGFSMMSLAVDDSAPLFGSANFDAKIGTTIEHKLGHLDYHVGITPTEKLTGCYYVEKAEDSFTVFHSGTATTKFDYLITLR